MAKMAEKTDKSKKTVNELGKLTLRTLTLKRSLELCLRLIKRRTLTELTCYTIRIKTNGTEAVL